MRQLGAYSDHSCSNKVIYKSLISKKLLFGWGLFTQNKTAQYWHSTVQLCGRLVIRKAPHICAILRGVQLLSREVRILKMPFNGDKLEILNVKDKLDAFETKVTHLALHRIYNDDLRKAQRTVFFFLFFSLQSIN